jgi:probable RNA-binding protein EIF1AD
MSKATKRKHVTKEVLDDYVLPEDNQKIVKVCNYIKKFLAFLYFLNVTENNILLLHYL